MSKITLTESQRAVLVLASQSEGQLATFPANLNGGARARVVRSLLLAELIETAGSGHRLTEAGYKAVGRKPRAIPAPKPTKASAAKQRGARTDTKQAQVLAMLHRPAGATIAQICEVTGWQKHTVRGTFAGAFKNKLGLTITSEKAEGEDRVYRIK